MAFDSWDELLGERNEKKKQLMGNSDVKAIPAGKTFALTAHPFFSSL